MARIASSRSCSAIIRINDFGVINNDEALKFTPCDNRGATNNERYGTTASGAADICVS
jgi:hypothetical protein